ncbi:MAG: toxin-antitoxin system protein [Bacteroidaceae bacterium]|jgi:predicted transcriptional regulator|nr:toxin-antitoxin system protein [Bacteroidaceae bacterium]
METATKVSTSFRLNAELVEKMKAAAKASNRSLNNFVESILLNVMSHETAENTTLAAIEEAKAQQQAYKEGRVQIEPIDLSNIDNMLKSMGI